MSSIVSIFKSSTSGNSTTLSVNTTSVTEGNLLLFVLAHDGGVTQRTVLDIERSSTSILGDMTALVATESSSHTMRPYLYDATASDAGDNTYTVTLSGNEKMCLFVIEIEEEAGLDAGALTSTLSSSAPSLTGVTTNANNALVITVLSVETSNAATTYPTGYTDNQDTIITSGGGGVRLSMASSVQVSAGATGNVVWGIASPLNSVGLVIAIATSVQSSPDSPGGYMIGAVDIQPAVIGSASIEPAMNGSVTIEPAMNGNIDIQPQ